MALSEKLQELINEFTKEDTLTQDNQHGWLMGLVHALRFLKNSDERLTLYLNFQEFTEEIYKISQEKSKKAKLIPTIQKVKEKKEYHVYITYIKPKGEGSFCHLKSLYQTIRFFNGMIERSLINQNKNLDTMELRKYVNGEFSKVLYTHKFND